ncbi:MAG: hypothetical protein KBE65_07700 [Phycisphaerae bacterium]|nr:hypothetical protein [Phycisphaerae bacterium]
MRAGCRFCGIVAAGLLLSIVSTSGAKYSGGTGEPNDPYQIATAADLIALGETPEDYNKHFILTADIDLDPTLPGSRIFHQAVIAPDTDSSRSDFQGIPFTGVLNGNGHTISHLTIKSGWYSGLFGLLGPTAEVKDLGVVDVNMTDLEDYAGGLAGRNAGSVSGCYCRGSVNGRHGRVGGLAGENWGSISNSRNMSSVNGFGHYVGGLAGDNSGIISGSFNRGSVISRGDHTGRGDCIGGLAGASRGLISNCRNTGSISGKGCYVGGLIGYNSCAVSNSCNTGSVAGGDDSVGGLAGGNVGSVSNCYSTGSVAGSGEFIGGLVGENEGSVSKSFWDMTSSGCATSAGGTGLTTAQMQDPNTFGAAGWDFLGERGNGLCETWQMPAEKGYPELSIFMGYLPPLLAGAGTPDDPYMVETAEGLTSVGYRPTACYRLTSDLDLSGVVWSTAIVPGFGGAFDGEGHKIRNMTLSGGRYLGLFGLVVGGADISGLGLEDVDIVGTGRSVGSLVGALRGHISQSYSTGSIRGTGLVGGLVGDNWGYVSESFSNAHVAGEDGCVGGLVGANLGSISNSYATGPVSGGDHVGGLIGYSEPLDVWDCYSTGPVSGTGDHVGGLVGWADWGTVSQCFWDVTTSGNARSAGGKGLTTGQMQTAGRYLQAGWDFMGETANGTQDIWWIDEGKDYPRLWWEQ